MPRKVDRGVLSLRSDYGLRLYSRKVLIQEHNKELLPEYLRFVEGVVDSEDIPLNVSRETVQSNRVAARDPEGAGRPGGQGAERAGEPRSRTITRPSGTRWACSSSRAWPWVRARRTSC